MPTRSEARTTFTVPTTLVIASPYQLSGSLYEAAAWTTTSGRCSSNVRSTSSRSAMLPSTSVRLELEVRLSRRAVSKLSMTETRSRSEEHTSELQSQSNLVCRLLLEKKKN